MEICRSLMAKVVLLTKNVSFLKDKWKSVSIKSWRRPRSRIMFLVVQYHMPALYCCSWWYNIMITLNRCSWWHNITCQHCCAWWYNVKCQHCTGWCPWCYNVTSVHYTVVRRVQHHMTGVHCCSWCYGTKSKSNACTARLFLVVGMTCQRPLFWGVGRVRWRVGFPYKFPIWS